jgi:LemA protein
MDIGIILIIILGVLIVWVIAVYNSLITAKNRTQESWSDIDVQLKRRYDLIPNLVESVKGYAKHEKETLENVIQARNSAMNANGVEDQAQAENMLSGTLKSLFALSENYPDLKANQNFLQLQDELSDTENKIQAARRFYNGNVRDFNIKIETFPNNAFSKMFSFQKFDFFEIEDKEKENIQVKF